MKPQMIIDGVAYVEAPEYKQFGGGCFGCAMAPIFSSACISSDKPATAAFGGDCGMREVIYIRATEASAQPEALRLAQDLDAYHTRAEHKQSAALLRSQHALIQEMLAALKWYVEEDDVIEGMPGNERFVAGKRRAEAVINKAEAHK